MSERIVVRSELDSHVLFSMFKAYYSGMESGKLPPREHRHADMEISAILSGEGRYCCADVEYGFSAGDVFFHCGSESHVFSYIEPDSARPGLVVIRFDSSLIWSPSGEWSNPLFLKLFSLDSPISRRIEGSSEAGEEISRLLNEMFTECQKREPNYDLVVKAKLMTILAYMTRHFNAELEADTRSLAGKRHLARMDMSVKHILSHLGEPLTLDQLAREACMSRSNYSSIFKALNGVSVWDYIVSHRIELARFKLETTGDSITQISEESGFASIGNFNRAFKKATGLTPREFRRNAGHDK